MDRPASFLLKFLYCLTVLGAGLLVGLSSWAGVRLSLSASPVALVLALGPLLFMAIAPHRVYLVVRGPGTLDAPRVAGIPSALRSFGIALIYLGAVAALLNFAAKPLMGMLARGSGGAGFALALVAIWVMLAAGLGLFGVILFEYSRLLAFEAQRRTPPTDERRPIPAAMLVPARRR